MLVRLRQLRVWTSEDITDSVDITDTGVIDIAVGADLSVLVMAATADGTYALQRAGTWEKTELEGNGGRTGSVWRSARRARCGATLTTQAPPPR